jgi:DNA modification methylase
VIPSASSASLTQVAIDKVAASLQEFGFRQPIVVDKDGVIIVGHVRLRAAKQLRWTEVPVHVAANLTPGQVKAYRLMDNRSHEEVEWDMELLGAELLELSDLDIEMALTGFDARELASLLHDPAVDEKADQVPSLPSFVVTQVGDIWRLGRHRIICGDAPNPGVVAQALGNQKPFLMVADPPYGVEYDPAWRAEVDGGDRHATGTVANDDRVDWTPAYRLFPGDVMYVWHAGVHAGEVAAGIISTGFQIRAQIIWRKQHFVFSRGAYHWQHEPCWYAVRTARSSNWHGDRSQSTVWDVPNANPHGGTGQSEQTGHGTQKPVELMRRPILNHTNPGDIVYDPFLGSGTTLVGAEITERTCYAVEIDPRYVDVAVERWQNLTRKQATLDGSGATFEHVKDGRRLGREDEIKEECLQLLEERGK